LLVVTSVVVRQQTPPGYGAQDSMELEAYAFCPTWVQAHVEPPFGSPGSPFTEPVQPSEKQVQSVPFEQHVSMANS
jgi:hypothetical protein